MKKNRIWFGRLSLAAFSSLVSLYACEAALRIFYIVPTPLANHYPLEAAKLGKEIHIRQAEFETRHRYNAQGFRGREITRKKSGDKRLLFVGDSFVEGFGVEEENRFSSQLVRQLGAGYEEVNIGQLATNPYVYLDNIEKFGIALEPDIIIMGIFLGNDFMGGRMLPVISGHRANLQVTLGSKASSLGPLKLEYLRAMWNQAITRQVRLTRKQEDKAYWELFFKEPVTKELYARLFKLSVPEMEKAAAGLNPALVQAVYSGTMHTGMFEEAIKSRLNIADEDPYYIEEDYVKTLACIQEAGRLAREHKIQFLVLLIPDINQVHPRQFQEVFAKDFLVKKVPARLEQLIELHGRLRNDLASIHIPFVDATDALKRSDVLTYYLYDNHMNTQGHQIVSDALLSEVRRLLAPMTVN